MKRYLLLLFVPLAMLASSCKDDNKEQPVTPEYSGLKFTGSGTLSIDITHKFNAVLLERNTDYVTAAEDTINVDKLRYYLSNVQLKNAEGVWVNMGNYAVVDIEDPASLVVSVGNIPSGIYSKVRFLIGVDSVANSSGAQEGALNPANDMFWSWSTGYVFFRLKGKYNTSGAMALDVGGLANLAVIEADLETFKKEGNNLTLKTTFNLAEVFKTPTVYDLKTMPSSIHSATSPGAPVLRDNIQVGVFSINTVE